MSSNTLSNALSVESHLIQTIYQSSDISSPWTGFMHQLVDTLDARSSRLLMMNGAANEVFESYSVNHDSSYIKQYVDHFVNECPWRPELAAKPQGMLYSSYLDFSCKQKAFRQTHFYNDWAKPQQIEHGMCGTIFHQQGKAVQLLVQRTEGAGHFTREETDFVNRLVPHIQNVITLRQNMESMQAVERNVTALAGRYSQPFALLDEQMNLCFISDLMKDVIEQSAGLKLSADKLVVRDSNENAKLYRLLKEASLTAAGMGDGQGGVVKISADYNQGLCLKVMPCLLGPDTASTFFGRSFVVVFLSSTNLKFSLAREQLSSHYGLTERESQLATLLCKGLSVDQIAEYNGVKASTLRKQLKSVYVKTGTHRQGELIVTLLNSLAASRC